MGNAASSAADAAESPPSCVLSAELAYDVLRHADVASSARAACACRALRDAQRSEMWWRLASERLGVEAKLYVPSTSGGSPVDGGTWKEAFFRLWACRDRWREPMTDEVEEARERFRRMIAGEDPRPEGEEEEEEVRGDATATAGEAAGSPSPVAGTPKLEQGSIKVCVRMRPRGANAPRAGPASAGGSSGVGVVLPLHQRLQIIKAQRGSGCSTGDAMRVLMEDSGRGAEASESPWARAEVPLHAEKEEEAATVTSPETALAPTLHRPLDDLTNKVAESGAAGPKAAVDRTTVEARGEAGEKEKGAQLDPTAGFEFMCGVLSVDEQDGCVLAVAPSVGLREFAFDAVFADKADQFDVYERSCRPLVADFVNGFNGTMLVYGQTGSGKTHTMFGPSGDSTMNWDRRGIVPRACEEVLEAATARASLGVSCAVSVSYVEVYGQEMTDLLRGGRPVGQSRVAGQRYVLDGHAEQPVCGMSDVLAALAKGDAQKRRAATAMNDRSSRAHTVFTVSLVQTDEVTGREMRSRLCLADLGGSEKLSKSRAHDGAAAAGTVPWEEYYARRQRLTEAVNINAGLLALKRCVDALHESQRAKREGKPLPHVPYQDSKLTTLLSSALGGDSKTVVLVAAAQEHAHATETLQSLRFGERCASVETRARVGANALAGVIAALNRRIEACEEEIKRTERWETVRTVRRDEVEGRDEVVLTSKLVGAEDLRRDLEAMLAERDFLSGRAAAQETSKESAARNGAADPVSEFEAAAVSDEM